MNNVVLTRSLAERLFENPDPTGSFLSVFINGKYRDLIVSGIIKDFPQNSSIKGDLLINIRNVFGKDIFDWKGSQRLAVFIQLSDKKHAEKLETAIPSWIKKYKDPENFKFSLQPLTGYHLKAVTSSVMVGESTPSISYIFTGIAFFVLIIASFNFTNLAIGRSTTRTKEIGVRKVLGAEKKQLINQFLFESVLQSFIALAAALLVSIFFLPVFNSLSEKSLSIYSLLNIKSIVTILTITILTGVLAGIYPSIVLSRFQSNELFRKKYNLSRKNIPTKSLILLQFSISIFLIITTIFLNNQYKFMLKKDMGYSTDNVLMIPVPNAPELPNKGKALLTNLKTNLKRHKNIVSVSGTEYDLTSYYPGILVNSYERVIMFFNTVDSEYLKTLDVKLLDGRNFSYENPADLRESVIVNETFVKELDIKNPLGKKFSEFIKENEKDSELLKDGFNKNHRIIGVVKDFHVSSLHDPIRPTFLTFSGEQYYRYILIKIHPENIQSTIGIIKKEFNNTAPFVPFIYTFLDEALSEKYNSEKRWSSIVNYSSLFAILIACSGLFGLTLLTISRRLKELSIRKVLGASTTGLVRLIQRDFITLVAIANIIGWPAAYFAVDKIFRNFSFKIPIGPLPFIIAGFAVTLIAFITIGVISIRAASVNPVENLRYE